ncbi:MAG: hypothetical protein H7Y03_07730 [Chitinophagaceae bacterium]|nr:hypothetical protein [Chitinophagaceae bacterium]
MGKDNNGAFHPGKGKPSGANKEEGLGVSQTPPEKMDQYIEMTEKYTTGADELAEFVVLRHPNRNTSKGNTSKANGAKITGGEEKKDDEEAHKGRNEAFADDRSTTVPEELPGILDKEIFTELANYKANCCVSVYMPTHGSGVEVNEQNDAILFKNNLQKIVKMLKDKGLEETLIERMMEPGYELLRNKAFWHNLSSGLALFISEGYFKYIKMPVAGPERVFVNASFLITPLLPLMITPEYYYLLVISKHKAKLFKADAYGMQFIPIEELPESIEDVKRISELDATTWRTGGRGGTGGANFHGIGGGTPDDKTNIAVYFEFIDDILYKKIFNKEHAPLVLAGVEYLIPIYRSVCDYQNVWADALTGSHEHEETPSLYRKSRELMEPYFRQGLEKALTLYGNQSATERTASIVADVVPAAHYGQISTLFVRRDAAAWGTFDDMNNQLVFHETEQPDSEDLINKAVVKTITQGGEVFILDREQMPIESDLAAIMRY